MTDKTNILPPGTRIRFPGTVEGESEIQGMVVFACAGEEGEVIGPSKCFHYRVKVDSWVNPFGANESDFDVIVEP